MPRNRSKRGVTVASTRQLAPKVCQNLKCRTPIKHSRNDAIFCKKCWRAVRSKRAVRSDDQRISAAEVDAYLTQAELNEQLPHWLRREQKPLSTKR